MKKLLKKIDMMIMAIVIIFSLCIPAGYYEIFSLLENQTVFFRHIFRCRFREVRESVFPYEKIALVGIDDDFFRKYGKYPVKRGDLAKIIRNLQKFGAKVICISLLMDLPDAYGEDPELAHALGQGSVVLASQAVFDDENRFVRMNYPTPLLQKSCPGGYVNLVSPSHLLTFLDRLRIYPEIAEGKSDWPIAVQTVAEYLEVRPSLRDGILSIGHISIPLDHRNDMYIDFSATPDGCRFIHQFAGISAYEFLDTSLLSDYERKELEDWVKGKIVILGESFNSSGDWFDTPVGMMYSSDIIADTVKTILQAAPLRPASPEVEILISLLILCSVILCTKAIPSPKSQLLYALLLLAGFVFFCTLLYMFQGLVISMTCHIMAGCTGFVLLSLRSYYRIQELRAVEKKEREKVERERQAAETANRAKSLFLANMSHEIRTPMNAILGFTELLEEHIREPQQRQYLAAIRTGGKSLMALISDILDLSKIESGKFRLEPTSVNLRRILEETEMIFSARILDKKLDFRIETDPDIPENLLLDEIRIRQILMNLIGNAINFTDKGYVKISVHNYNPFGNQKDSFGLMFSVEDTGIGIPESDQKRIFRAFEQQEGQDHCKYGGTGLGLAISRHLVEMMDGEIHVSSNAGKGSVFYFILKNVKVASEPAPETESRIFPEIVRFGKAGILIAEDTEMNRELVKGYLRNHPFRISEAADGEAAIRLAGEEQPDIILMDLRMPVMDGYEAVKIIKTSDRLKHIPVIALSASGEGEIRNSRTGEGKLFDAFLEKPVSKIRLIETLARFLIHTVEDSFCQKEEPEGLELILPWEPEKPELLRELHEILRGEVHTQWKELSAVLFIDKIEQFGVDMQKTGAQYHYPPLSAWGKELENRARCVDIEEIPKILRQFPRILEKLDDFPA